jgi:hypothetical protein
MNLMPYLNPAYYGTCPECRQVNGCLPVGSFPHGAHMTPEMTRWFVCHDHLTKWHSHAGDIASPRDDDDKRADGDPVGWEANAALLAGYVEVVPHHDGPPPQTTAPPRGDRDRITSPPKGHSDENIAVSRRPEPAAETHGQGT